MVTDQREGLWLRMRELAATGHARASELRSAADALQDAVVNAAPIPKLIGVWARARRVWSECSGEPLV